MLRRAAVSLSSVGRQFIQPRTFKRGFATEAAATDDNLLSLTFVLPHEPLYLNKKVNMVVIPSASGLMGVSKNHIPTIAELKPGVVTIVEGGKQEKYFISGGFAFIPTDKTQGCQISAVEAVPVDQIDPDLARSGFTHYSAEFAKAQTDAEKATARIGLELHKQLCAALNISV
eukprot:TRINITY_DN5972_c0_g1_i1.p1 TRINITY_DN5972_c0_g1~~TRINITY_DN5972_c0_g1_i1.p1  ORF type:complete len:173 (-),score=33.44 TRINITY_DN5972_c0_g1_i1:195-713(-)